MERKETLMSSEIIEVLVMVALAIGGVVYLARHSRRDKEVEKGDE